jgi:beta-RFAP synthase
LVGRYVFPPEWRIVLLRPTGETVWHGSREYEAFSHLTHANPTEALCRILLTGMLPALAAQDVDAFGEALYEYNTRAGEGFAAAQDGAYASAVVADCVQALRRQGVRGAGQSSWGPTVFAVIEDVEKATWLRERLNELAAGVGPIAVTRGNLNGARYSHQ